MKRKKKKSNNCTEPLRIVNEKAPSMGSSLLCATFFLFQSLCCLTKPFLFSLLVYRKEEKRRTSKELKRVEFMIK